MDELLEKELRKPSLIKNPRVLDLKYIPKKLLHREEEQKMLSEGISRIYVHIQNASQRPKAEEFLVWLEAQGIYSIPPIEQVTVGPPTTQVRYFREEDKADAMKLVDYLKKEVDVAAQVKDLSKYYKDENIPLGYFEVWFGPK